MLQIDRSMINPQMILAAAQKTMAPYKLTYEYCDWWTAYQIGQRVSSDFAKAERVFLAGDAVHTHSPKAGQGMNVSMQDAYNLGWKLAAVLNGQIDRSILKTYQSERLRIAQELIDFDHRLSRLFSGRPAKDIMDEEGISMDEFKDAFVKGNMFSSGVAVNYGSSLIVCKDDSIIDKGEGTDGTDVSCKLEGLRVVGKQDLATNIKIGMRMPSFKVLSQADARPWHFQERLKSDGRWRVVVFAGDISSPPQMLRLQTLGNTLLAPESFISKFTSVSKPIDSVIEVLLIHSAPRTKIEFHELPEIVRPFDTRDGYDYSKAFVDDMSYHEGHGHAYQNYGIDEKKGAAVILRPDQYVSWIGELDDTSEMERFFSGFMREQY